MFNFLKKLVLSLGIISIALTLNMAYFQGAVLASDIQVLNAVRSVGDGVGTLPGFIDKGQHVDAPSDFAQPGVGALTSPILFAIDLFRYVVSGLAVIMIVIASVQLISTASDEEAKKWKTTLLVGILGLLIIQFAGVAVRRMFFGEQGDVLEDPAVVKIYAEETVNQLRGIIGFLNIFVGVAAVFTIVIRGFALIVGAGNEESISRAKAHVIYAVVGLVAVGLSQVIVMGVVFPESGNQLPSVEGARYVIVNIVNFLSGFIALFAFLALFYGGYRYVISAGNEEVNDQVKKIALSAVIALVLSLGAFAIVNTLINIPVAEEGVPPSTQNVNTPGVEPGN